MNKYVWKVLAQCQNTAAKFAKFCVYKQCFHSIHNNAIPFKSMLSHAIKYPVARDTSADQITDFHGQLLHVTLHSRHSATISYCLKDGCQHSVGFLTEPPYVFVWRDYCCLCGRWFHRWLLRSVAPYRRNRLAFWNLVSNQLKGIWWWSNKTDIPDHLLWDWWCFLRSVSKKGKSILATSMKELQCRPRWKM